MEEKMDVWQGTLALMVLKTLNVLGPQHGYGIAKRIEQTSGNLLEINHGTLYPVLLKLELEGSIASEWGVSDNNRRAKFYRITKSTPTLSKTRTRAEARDYMSDRSGQIRLSRQAISTALRLLQVNHSGNRSCCK